jgi:hypothetical protein
MRGAWWQNQGYEMGTWGNHSKSLMNTTGVIDKEKCGCFTPANRKLITFDKHK